MPPARDPCVACCTMARFAPIEAWTAFDRKDSHSVPGAGILPFQLVLEMPGQRPVLSPSPADFSFLPFKKKRPANTKRRKLLLRFAFYSL